MPNILSLNVKEIFINPQGEGARAGTMNIFIRLAGCNLDCPSCDTDFKNGIKLTLGEIQSLIQQYFPVKNIIWTGGEPTLQLTNEIVNWFKEFGYYQAIESNGTKTIPEGIDYKVLSPKITEKGLIRYNKKVNELRYPIKYGDKIPKPLVEADYYYLSPIFVGVKGNKLSKRNINWVIKLIKENPKWRITVQIHKLLKLR